MKLKKDYIVPFFCVHMYACNIKKVAYIIKGLQYGMHGMLQMFDREIVALKYLFVVMTNTIYL